MKTKFLRFFVIIISIFIFVISISNNVIAKIVQTTRGSTQNFGITLIHESPYLSGSGTLSFGYRLDNRNAYRIYSGNQDYENTIICLDKDGKFPNEDQATGNYQSLGEATATTLNEANSSINATKAKEILWVMNNAVLPEDSENMRNLKLSKIFAGVMASTANTANPITITDIKQYVTEDDLVFAYQCAVWEATNGSILSKTFQGNSTGNNSDWDGLDGNDRWRFRGRKGAYIKEMINYYINHFDGNQNIVPSSSSTAVNPKITKPSSNTYEKSGSKLFVGPFKIEPSQVGKDTVDYSIEFTFKNASGTKLSIPMGSTGYMLTNSASTSTTLLQQTKESLEGKEFYFAFPLNTAVRTIEIELTTATMKSDTTGTVWKAQTGNNNQPLLSITREETSGSNVNDTYTFNVTTTSTYDVALRKSIVGVLRKNVLGNWSYVSGTVNQRNPEAVAATGTNPFNQINYNHRKNPVEVKVGDRVVYGIKLYNEGETTLRVKQIVDHLPPSGLNFITSSANLAFPGAVNAKCTKSGDNIIYSNPTQQYLYEIDPNMSAPTIYLEFEVTADATGKIVTNIAEITEMTDTSGNPLSNDIDSAPDNAVLPTTEEEWQNYKGNDNQDDLTDTSYYYKGYEDEDDFEKITVPMNDGQYTLKIVKVDSSTNEKLSGATFIGAVNGANKSVTASGTAGEYNLETISITETGTDRVVITESSAPPGYEKLVDSILINVVKANNNGTYGITASLVNTGDSDVTLSQTGTQITITVKNKKKIMDMALRKYITKIGGENVTNTRVPDIDESTLASGTTATYKHRKDPIEVKTNDEIVYNITVYNEGEVNGRVTKIVDQLPRGIQYVSVEGDIYTGSYDTNTNRVTLTRKSSNTTNLAAYTSGDPKSETVQIKCKITAQPTGEEQIFTNVAWIAEEINAETNETIITETGKDRDSEPGTTPSVNQDNMSNYTGKNTESDLTKSDKYYEGQQDDDDFEKVKLNPATGVYVLKIVKVDSSTNEKLSGATFIGAVNGTNKSVTASSTAGEYNLETISIKETGTDNIVITESSAPPGYEKLIDSISINVVKTNNNGTYTASASLANSNNQYVELNQNGTEIVVTVKNKKLEGKYNLQIIKVDSEDNTKKLSGAKFKVTLPNNQEQILTTDSSGQAKTSDINIEETGTDTIKIEETEAPAKYEKLIDTIEVNITKAQDGDVYKITNATLKNTNNNVNISSNENTIVITIQNKKKKYDLALKKYITKIEGKDVTPRLVLDDIDVSPLQNGGHDAEYPMDKTVLKVKTGDIVRYTIRIFNEGEIDGYAEKIKDDIPEGLEFVENSEINRTYRWKVEDGNVVTDYLSKEVNPDKQIKAFNKETGKLDSQYVEIEFRMTSKVANKIIKNIAQIKEDDGDDDDSAPDNDKPEEDDQDYDNIVPLPYDLALKKFITGVTDTNGTKKKRAPEQERYMEVEDVSELVSRNGNKADAQYRYNKTPVQVAKGDYVTYTIRIYNEGLQDGKALEIRDTIPEGLEFVGYTKSGNAYSGGSRINYDYGWKMYDSTGKETTDTSKAKEIRTEYLKDTVIPAFDKTKVNEQNKGLSYADVQVEFRVVTDETRELINIAEITKDDGDDDDSTPDDDNPNEDDQDYDVVIPGRFDLSLRKFITKIDRVAVTDRVPKVDTTKLDNGEETTAKYEHTKEPKVVVKGNIVTYTIRVYNEGTVNGYVEEIKDDLPEGITFLPDHETNEEYGWKMYDSTGKETTDVSKATNIRTTYAARESETGKLLKAYDKETMEEPDYIDVKVAFEVTLKEVTAKNKVIINTAEISDDADEYGNEVEDIDSTPDDGTYPEDDIDKEYLVLKYFDLSLLKYVSKVIVIEDGITKETETNYNGMENPEPIVKVELNKKKLASTEVRYVYTIKITNEGEIEGYAKEIKDRIPDGLVFFEEDNTAYNWKTESEGVVTTDYLKDTLLQPGESSYVQITLRWKNAETNLGQKINVAEISKDENPYGAPDIDSTPDNNKDGEDDQDEAIVLLSLNTGSAPQIYFVIGIVVVAIMGTGIYAIKKFVL